MKARGRVNCGRAGIRETARSRRVNTASTRVEASRTSRILPTRNSRAEIALRTSSAGRAGEVLVRRSRSPGPTRLRMVPISASV